MPDRRALPRVLKATLTVLLLGLIVLSGPSTRNGQECSSVAFAATCYAASAPNYHALGYTKPGGTFYGGTAKFPEKTYTASDWSSGGFVSNVLWNLHPGGYWSEIGFTKGWQGQNIYAFYVAHNRPTYGYYEWKLSKSPSGSGTQHTYSISPSSTSYTVWRLKLDSDETYLVNMLLETSDNLQAGGEETSSQSTMGSTTSSTLKYYTGRGQAGATSWPNDQSKTICYTRSPMKWDWVSYPTSGKAWAP